MAVSTRPDPTRGNTSGSSADAPKHGEAGTEQQWAPRPWLARLIRVFAFVFPIGMSVVFVVLASKVVPAPAGWFGRALWWIGLTVLATFVLIGFERLTRRLLPLVTLFKLSIAFPDEAPSRFKMAMRTNTVRQLERQLREGDLDHTETPADAAEHLLALANMLNTHDRMTRGHTERVRAYTLMIGEQMGLPADELNKLHWAALIHDVGKLDVPASILNKEGKPTDEEWAILREHPKYGGELVAPLVPWLGEWAKAAEQHHERWDGKGYPYGLSEHQISRAGRIVAVADAFDVITSVRSYKAAFTPEEARAELATCAGTQFDPGVVRAFLNVSLGRLRLAMGPLSWLAHVPILARVPLTAGIGTTTASGGGAAIAATAGAAATGLAAVTGLAVPNIADDEPAPDEPSTPVAAVVAPDELVDIVGSLDEDGVYDVAIDDVGAVDADVVSAGDPSIGTVRMLDDGTMRFVPPADYFGPAEFAVEGCWDDDCRSADVSLDVLPVNDAPRPGIDTVEMFEDGRVNVDVLANDYDPEDDAMTLVSASVADVSIGRRQAGEPAGVDLSVIGQEVWLAPPDDYFGTVSIDYTVADAIGAQAAGRVTIVIGSVNDAPIALDDAAEGIRGGEARVAVLANDYDVDGDVLDVAGASSATLSPTVSGDTVVIPLDGAVGDHLVDYTVIDGDGAANDARVVVTITAAATDNPPPPAPPPAPPSPPSSTTTLPPPPANEPPIIENRTLVVDEDTNGALDVAAATSDSDGTVEPGSLTVTNPPDAALGQATVFDGAVVFVPQPDAFGTTSVGVSICDDDGDCGAADMSVIVKPVNDPPSFELLTERITAVEDSDLLRGPLVTDIAAGPANESNQDVTFDVWYPPANEDLFDVPPFVAVDGTARVRPAPDASGQSVIRITATDSGGADQEPMSVSANVLFVVDEVNDPPTFGVSAPFAVFEDSGPYTGTWIVDIDPGPVSEAGQTMSFDLDVPTPDQALFSVQPSIDADGVLRFTPAPNMSGSTEIAVTGSDDGGLALGGVDKANPVTLALAIFEVNDPPTIGSTAGPVTVDEDSGGYDALWASGVSPGPAAESGQTVGFEVEVPPGDQALFSELPHLTPDGQLHFTPAIDGHGSTTLTVRPVDDGGTPNGGDDTGLDETLPLTINPLNDAPMFVPGADVVVVENSGPQTFPGWATGIGPGPNEAGQSVSFTAAVLVSGPGFATAPAVAPNGDLTFETAFLGTGTATIEVTAVDDGPSGGGNINQSAPEVVTITATPAANQSPVAGGFSVPATEDSAPIDIDVTPFVSDPDDLVTSLSASVGFTETARGGSVSIVGPRTIRYTPAPDVTGDDTFVYEIADPDLAVDTGAIVVQLANSPDAPVADDDGYVTGKNNQLTVPAASGVLGNDIDIDPGPLAATLVSAPPVGSVALAADGSFTYDPAPGFTGRTSFTYRATGAAGSDTATVDILVDSGVYTPTVFLGQTGPDPEHYDFLYSPPAPVEPEPDVDMDSHDGHTLVDAGVPGTGGDPARSQHWYLELPEFGELDGPGYLEVWSQVRDTASMGPDALLHAEVYECAPDLTGCVRFAEASAYDENWSSGWASRVINFGHITRTLTPGNVVKLSVESTHADLLVAASGNRPSRLVGTSPNQPPEVTDIDLTGPAGILEGATVVVDLAAATADIDTVPNLTSVTAGPANGVVVDNGDGTVSYTPDPGFSGDDQFDFELTDSNGQTGSATVFIHVIDTNGQPYMTRPEGAFSVWVPEATGEVRPNGNWRFVFDVEPGYQTGYFSGQYFVQSPILLTDGDMSPGVGEFGEELTFAIDSIDDPDGVLAWIGGGVLEPGDWFGFYQASDYTLMVDFATTDNEGTAIVKVRLDDGNATNNLSDDLIVFRIKNYD